MAEVQYKPPVIYSTGKTEFPIHPKTDVPTPEEISITSDEVALRNNLTWGLRANEWANRYIRFADNRFEDKFLSFGSNHSCVQQMRAEVDGFSTGADYVGRIRERAMIASRYGCGNCDEQSAVAFTWLYDWYWSVNKRRNASLARMEIANGDHVFVIIGFPFGKADTPVQWGPRSVVVDPWNYAVYPAAGIRLKRWMSGGEVYKVQTELPTSW